MDTKKEPSKTLIYVSNLPFDTTDEQFQDLFKGFGIKTAYVAKRKNGKSKGFGFVNLENDTDQKAAIENVNGKELNSRKLIARIAYNDERRNENGELREEFRTQTQPVVASETVVYISNLAWTITNESLQKIFSEFNPKSATVAVRKNGKSKGFGFVEFNNKEDREKALSLDQKTFEERQISVKPSTGYRGDQPTDSNRPRRNRDNNNNNNNNRRRNNDNRDSNRNDNRRRRNSRSPTKRSPQGNNSNNNNNNDNNRRTHSEFTIYIKNLPFELDETDLKDVFSEFNPKAANIPRNHGRSKGFGFVEFSNSKDQNEAVRALDQSEINGRLVTISVSNQRRSNNNNNNRDRSPRRNNRSPRRNRNGSRNGSRTGSRDNRRRGSKTRDNNNRRDNNNNNRKSNVSSEQSKTNIYVSNIPFSISESKLEEFFGKDLKINKLTIPKKRNGDSFGYAFVELASNEDQQKALKFHDTTLENRKIVVQAAYNRTSPSTTTSTPTTNPTTQN